MTTLVTGATGFIGRALCHRLRETGVRVRALARRVSTVEGPWDEMVAADLTEPLPPGVTDGIECIFHLAGKVHALSEVRDNDEEYERLNVGGTSRLLEAAAASGTRCFVFFSSVKAMGEQTATALDESEPPRPQTGYGRSKRAAEELVQAFSRRPGRQGVSLRLPLVYGVGNKGNLHRMIAAIDRGFFPPLPETGNRRSMVHVANVVEAALLVSSRDGANGQIFIVTDGRDYSTRELYEAICEGLGRAVPVWSIPLFALAAAGRIGDVVGFLRRKRFFFDSDALEKLLGSACYSSAKLARDLGYSPQTAFPAALPAILEWYRTERAQHEHRARGEGDR